ncbi:MAG TPA: hypothetical protein VIY90_19150 [Steroidobacteraceae bacterium]
MNGQTKIYRGIGDDTIELELTAEQLRVLSQAAELEEPVASAPIAALSAPARVPTFFAPPPLVTVGPSSRSRRRHYMPMAKMAGAIIGYLTFAWWGASQLAWQPEPPAPAAARPAVITPGAAILASSPQQAVRVTNPFDATEVFEFPTATSYAADRDKVAQLLLRRARERQSQWEHIKPVAGLRTASLYHHRKPKPVHLRNTHYVIAWSGDPGTTRQ